LIAAKSSPVLWYDPVVKVPGILAKADMWNWSIITDLLGIQKMITEFPTVNIKYKIPGGHLCQQKVHMDKTGIGPFFA
jgi:hypothetical protein